MSIYLEFYIYIGLISGWWFSKKLSKELNKYEVNNTSIYWVIGIMFLLLWPLTIWSANESAATQIARTLRKESS